MLQKSYFVPSNCGIPFLYELVLSMIYLSVVKLISDVGRLVVVIDVNPSHGFWTRRLMKLFGHEGK
jgi:hypothetical protein